MADAYYIILYYIILYHILYYSYIILNILYTYQLNSFVSPRKLKNLAECDSHFTDSNGYECAKYAREQHCTTTGGYGSGWSDDWGTFADYAVNGKDALSCPQCGCIGNPIFFIIYPMDSK